MYRRHVKGLSRESDMLLLTKGDVEWAAQQLNESGSRQYYYYEAKPRFLGYEGYDGGVCQYLLRNGRKHSFVQWVEHATLCKMVTDAARPTVPQADSHKDDPPEAIA